MLVFLVLLLVSTSAASTLELLPGRLAMQWQVGRGEGGWWGGGGNRGGGAEEGGGGEEGCGDVSDQVDREGERVSITVEAAGLGPR